MESDDGLPEPMAASFGVDDDNGEQSSLRDVANRNFRGGEHERAQQEPPPPPPSPENDYGMWGGDDDDQRDRQGPPMDNDIGMWGDDNDDNSFDRVRDRREPEPEVDADDCDTGQLPRDQNRLGKTGDYDTYFLSTDAYTSATNQLSREWERLGDDDADDDAVARRQRRRLDNNNDDAGQRSLLEDEDDDDQGEADENAMTLPNVLLDDPDLYMQALYTRICDMGKETTRLLRQLMLKKIPLSPSMRRRCKGWLVDWIGYVVEHHYGVLGRVQTLPLGKEGAKKKVSASASMMWEIFRLKLILGHQDLNSHMEFKIADSEFLVRWLLETPGVDLDPKPLLPEKPGERAGPDKQATYQKLLAVYESETIAFKERRPLSDTPIMRMKQSQLRALVMHVTSRIEVIPFHAELQKLIHVLELKAATFFCRSMPSALMDQPAMRTDLRLEAMEIARLIEEEIASKKTGSVAEAEYAELVERTDALRKRAREEAVQAEDRYTISADFLFFCTCYFYPLMRFTYYAETFSRLSLARTHDVESYLPPGSVDRLKNWCVQLILQQGLKYNDRLTDVAADAMLLPGDLEWLAYRFPDESTHIDTVLRKTRGDHYYYAFRAQTELSYQVMMGQVGVSRVSDMFVMQLFGRYLEAYKGTRWMDGYVIHNHYIDDDATMDKWTESKEPFLIAVASSFWLMLEGKVLPISNVYVAICMWMRSIRLTRKKAGKPVDCLYDNTYIGDIIDAILYGKGSIAYIHDKAGQTAYTDSLKRGIIPETTRFQI